MAILLRFLRALVFSGTVLLTAVVLCGTVVAPLTIALLYVATCMRMHHPWCRVLQKRLQRAMDNLIACWYSVPIGVMRLLGVRFRVFTSPLQYHQAAWCNSPTVNRDRTVFVSNHPTDADWIFLWALLAPYFDLSALRILLKAPLRRVPIIGWTMTTACHLFLERSWQQDGPHIEQWCQYYRRARPQQPVQCLIFPEGTNTSNVQAQEKSSTFAKEHQLASYTHVLHPRTTGFVHLMQQLVPKHDERIWIYDITIAFMPLVLTLSGMLMGSLFRGQFPREVCFYVEAHHVCPNEAEKWVVERFARKEQRLSQFHTRGGHFVEEDGTTPSVELQIPWTTVCWSYVSVLVSLTLAILVVMCPSAAAACAGGVLFFVLSRVGTPLDQSWMRLF